MKYLIVFFLFFATQARAASAPPADFGLGLMVGTMISMTGKYWLDKHGALDFGVSSAGSRGMAIYADYPFSVFSGYER